MRAHFDLWKPICFHQSTSSFFSVIYIDRYYMLLAWFFCCFFNALSEKGWEKRGERTRVTIIAKKPRDTWELKNIVLHFAFYYISLFPAATYPLLLINHVANVHKIGHLRRSLAPLNRNISAVTCGFSRQKRRSLNQKIRKPDAVSR